MSEPPSSGSESQERAPNTVAPAPRSLKSSDRNIAQRVRRWLRSPGVTAAVQAAEYIAKVAAVVSIVVSGWTYITGKADRDEAKYRDAWQVINSAHGQPGSGGRIHALEILARGQQPLDGVSLNDAYLRGVSLKGTSLNGASFRRATLESASLHGVEAAGADFSSADLTTADFSEANLFDPKFNNSRALFAPGKNHRTGTAISFAGARLNGIDARTVVFDQADFSSTEVHSLDQPASFDNSVLWRANFTSSHIADASFAKATLSQANFQSAYLMRVSFANACLNSADFSHAILTDVWFRGADLDHANFSTARLLGSSEASLRAAQQHPNTQCGH